ncbi:MAG: LPS assembly protein LptD [Rhodobacteraceae bacterium]|nr:LPS assembly protein LptD [Paracoccaceae bacterium]
MSVMLRIGCALCAWVGLLGLVGLLGATGAVAQTAPAADPPTALVADRVTFANDDTLIAEGNVQVFSAGRELRASKLTYNTTDESLLIEGPILLRDGEETVVLAEAAELDTELETGIMTSAQVLIQQRLQITGAQMERRTGGFNDFRQVVATSCEICRPGQAPLWQVRARRVIQDENAERIYFYDAQFRVFNLPVFYLPVMRIPEPGVERATGFLFPEFLSSSLIGNAVRVPYFITLGRSADLTLAPHITDGSYQTVEARYRQAFRRGTFTATGAISEDEVKPDETRGYLFAAGLFALPQDFTLAFDYEYTSDRTYLLDYDFSSKDILDSAIGISRVRSDELISASVTNFESLREADIGNERSGLIELDYRRNWEPASIGGLLEFRLIGQSQSFEDNIRNEIDSPNVNQVRGTVDYRRDWTVGPGFRFGTEAELNFDYLHIIDDPDFPEYQTAFTPTFAADLSLPLIAPDTNGSGVSYLLEPIGQLVWTRPDTLDNPNEDSTSIALDTGNLFALNRFPGLDRYETGLRSNLALRWARLDPAGVTMGVTVGRVLRFGDSEELDEIAVLDGDASDWLTQVDLDFGNRLRLRNLLLLDDDGAPSFNEARASWAGTRVNLNAAYVWQQQDTSALLDNDLSELALLGGFSITQNFSATFDLRRDFILDRTNRIDLGLAYENECIRVDLTAQRRFISNSGDETDITYGLQVQLAGFGTDIGRKRARRVCTALGRVG